MILVSTSKSDAMVLSWKKVDYPLQVRSELLSQVEGLKYLEFLFRTVGRSKHEINRKEWWWQ